MNATQLQQILTHHLLDSSAFSPVAERMIYHKDSSMRIADQQVENVSVAENSSTATHWNEESATLGFGIPDTTESTQIVNWCFGIVLIIIGLAGASGNGLVLYVFTRYRRLRGGAGPLILSLASGDFVVSIFHILPAISSFNNKWFFGSFGCSLYAAIVGLCGIASLLTLSAIAADRFSVIVGRPLAWLAGKKTCLAIWILSVFLTSPPLFGWSRFCLEGLHTSCTWDYVSRDFHNRLYYIFLLTFGFLLPVTIIIVSYVGILWVVCKQKSQLQTISIPTTNRRKLTKNDIKTAQVIFTIIICFLVAWTPYAIVSLVGQFGDPATAMSPMGTALPAIFAKTSVIFNPIVYGLSHPHFRSAVRTLYGRSCCGRNYRPQNGSNKEFYQYNYIPTKINKRCTPTMKQLSVCEGVCNGNERLRRETRHQGNAWQQQSTSTKYMSDHTTGKHNENNLNMVLVVQDNSLLEKQLLFFENPEQISLQGVQSISRYCTHRNSYDEYSGDAGQLDAINLSEPNLNTLDRHQVMSRIMDLLADPSVFNSQTACHPARRNLEKTLSRSENCLFEIKSEKRQKTYSIQMSRRRSSGINEASQSEDTANNNIKHCKNLYQRARNDDFNFRPTSQSAQDGLQQFSSGESENWMSSTSKLGINYFRSNGMAYMQRSHVGNTREGDNKSKSILSLFSFYKQENSAMATRFPPESGQSRRASAPVYEDQRKHFGTPSKISMKNGRTKNGLFKRTQSRKPLRRWMQKYSEKQPVGQKILWMREQEQASSKYHAPRSSRSNSELVLRDLPEFCSSFM